MSFHEMFPNSRLSLSKWPKDWSSGHMEAKHIVPECWRFATGHSSTLAFGNIQALLETFGQNNKTYFNLISLFYFPKARSDFCPLTDRWVCGQSLHPLRDIIRNEWAFFDHKELINLLIQNRWDDWIWSVLIKVIKSITIINCCVRYNVDNCRASLYRLIPSPVSLVDWRYKAVSDFKETINSLSSHDRDY